MEGGLSCHLKTVSEHVFWISSHLAEVENPSQISPLAENDIFTDPAIGRSGGDGLFVDPL